MSTDREKDLSTADVAILESVHPEPMVPRNPVYRRREFWRWTITCALALLFHIAVLALIIMEMPRENQYTPPPSIPIEIVQLPPEPEKKQEAQKQEEPKQEEKKEEKKPEPLARKSGATDKTDIPAGDAPKVETAEKTPEPAKQELSPQEEKVEKPAPEQPKLRESETGTEPKVQEMAKAFQGAPIPDLPPAFELPTPRRGFSGFSSSPGGGGDPYLNSLRDKIVANLAYPPGSESRRGVAVFQAVISRNGQLQSVQVVESSGFKDLDQVGLKAIRSAAPFRRLPSALPGDKAIIEISLRLGT
ncbi:protein TonB [Rhodoligotrophos appendicifer]|uniref:TonB family protein n=1 Tax=Rhodoligotrophos appendicifer TaxID=987056 RepID=UPI0014780E7A|nr:TonB family protein [Rhodoligotrophos appendicifer]